MLLSLVYRSILLNVVIGNQLISGLVGGGKVHEFHWSLHVKSLRVIACASAKEDAMRKRVQCSLIALYGVLLIFVVGCSAIPQSVYSNERSSPFHTPLTAVDWANFTYFSSCYEN